jgi:hypothetical protein
MINDKILKIWEEEYAQDFIIDLDVKLETYELKHTTTDIIKVWQYLDLNNMNLENYLFTKY